MCEYFFLWSKPNYFKKKTRTFETEVERERSGENIEKEKVGEGNWEKNRKNTRN